MSPRQERRIRFYGVQREKPDLRKLARALIEMARLEAAVEASVDEADRNIDNGGEGALRKESGLTNSSRRGTRPKN